MRKHWAILGAGSIGCLWTAKLCQAGINPTLILRPDRYRKLTSSVAQVNYSDVDAGSNTDYSVNISSAEHLHEPVDILIVCTKAQHANAAAQSIKHTLHPDTIILLLQNGMGSQQAIASTLPCQSIWTGSVTDGAYLKKPFAVCHAGKGVTLTGKFSGLTSSAEKQFIRVLSGLPLDIHIISDIEQKLWDKLAINCCINGLTALYNCKNGELLDSDYKQQHLNRLISETQVILQALDKASDSSLKARVEEVCHNTANNISSTCNDVRIGRATELSYINGFLINAASSYLIPVSEHELLLAELKKQGIQI